jgi:hypothetical protein
MSNYSHMFKSRIRFFSRVLGCLYTVLPGVLPAKMKPISDEVRMASIMRMKVLLDPRNHPRVARHVAHVHSRFQPQLTPLVVTMTC